MCQNENNAYLYEYALSLVYVDYLLVVPSHVLVVRLLAAELLLALTAIPLLLLCCVAFKGTFHLGLVFECSVTPWMWACDCGLVMLPHILLGYKFLFALRCIGARNHFFIRNYEAMLLDLVSLEGICPVARVLTNITFIHFSSPLTMYFGLIEF